MREVILEIDKADPNSILIFAIPLGNARVGEIACEVVGIGNTLEFVVTDPERTSRYRVNINKLAEVAIDMHKTDKGLDELIKAVTNG